jgi:hypothetical protein
MAYKAYRPYKPDFRTVSKLRGKSADPRAIAQKPPTLDPLKSIYQKDYNEQIQNQMGYQPQQATNSRGNRNLKE